MVAREKSAEFFPNVVKFLYGNIYVFTHETLTTSGKVICVQFCPLLVHLTIRLFTVDGVDTNACVSRTFHVQGWSVEKIVGELHVFRNAVRKIVLSSETDFSYERADTVATGSW
ncbi:UNVERIFIED_ORG: hypothetical protein J2S29_002782 [Rhizobium sp. SLBN-170]